MDTGFLTCPICYDEFDQTKHLARIIPTCGHTVCSRCLFSLLQNPNPTQRRCPIDSQLFTSELNNIEAFKVNYVVNQILEAQSQREICKEHHEEMTFVCFTDKSKICNTCVSDGGHQSHRIKGLKAIKAEASGYSKNAKEILKGLDSSCSEVFQTSREMKTLLLKKVKDEFEELRKKIYDKEQDIIFQINTTFYNQELKMENFLGIASEVRKSLEDKANELENNFKSQELFCDEQNIDNLRQFFARYNVEFDEDAIEDERDIIKDKIEDMFDGFKRGLNAQTEAWSRLTFALEEDIFKGLSRGVFKDLPMSNAVNNNDIRMETEEVSALFKIQTQLNFEYDKEKLTISTRNIRQNNVLINIYKWKNAKDVVIKITDKISDDEDLQILNFVWRRLKANGSLYFEIESIEKCREILHQLSQRKTLFSEIEISVKRQDLSEEREALQSIAGLLTATPALKALHLDFTGSKLTRPTLQALLEERLSDSKVIVDFSLNLADTGISDDDICHLPFALSKLKYFWISFDNTRVTNTTIGWLASKLSKPMKNLEGLALYLNAIKITDIEIDALLSKLGNIKRLTLDLGRTNIRDRTLKALGQAMCKFNDNLEIFELGLHNCDISDEGLRCVFMPFPKITKLNLILSSTELTNKSLEEFAQKTLPTTTNMKSLELNLANTEITDIGMQQVFNNMGDLNHIEIGLTSTEVSDFSVAPFIIDKVLNMGNLIRFQMEVGNTQISEEVKAKIRELQGGGKVETTAKENPPCPE